MLKVLLPVDGSEAATRATHKLIETLCHNAVATDDWTCQSTDGVLRAATADGESEGIPARKRILLRLYPRVSRASP